MTEHYSDPDNEMVEDFDDVVELGKEMEQISEQNAEEHHYGGQQDEREDS
ncbi:SAS053 family DNA gyrase inhibitor [Macrococcus carouselicus]|nr:SAS053 family protein [Macrococcus carouselicus]